MKLTVLVLLIGTVTILEGESQRIDDAILGTSNLKYDKTGKVLLVPQPSDDPNE